MLYLIWCQSLNTVIRATKWESIQDHSQMMSDFDYDKCEQLILWQVPLLVLTSTASKNKQETLVLYKRYASIHTATTTTGHNSWVLESLKVFVPHSTISAYVMWLVTGSARVRKLLTRPRKVEHYKKLVLHQRFFLALFKASVIGQPIAALLETVGIGWPIMAALAGQSQHFQNCYYRSPIAVVFKTICIGGPITASHKCRYRTEFSIFFFKFLFLFLFCK